MTSLLTEYDLLIENKGWGLVPRPAKQNILNSIWVLKIKKGRTVGKTLGTQLNSRLADCGNARIEGADNLETISPAAKLTSIRTVIVVVSKNNLLLKQMDVVAAFLSYDLNKEVFMKQLKGF